VFCRREVERKYERRNKAAHDEKPDDEGEGPSFSGKRVGHFVNVFWECTEKQGLENPQDVNRVEGRCEWQEKSQQRVGFEGAVEEEIFRAEVEGSRKADEGESADEKTRSEPRCF
jgi:hypothetical protein